MPKTGISMSKNTIIFHYEAQKHTTASFNCDVVSLVVSEKCQN